MSIAYDGPSILRLNEQLYDFMTDTSSPAFEDDTWRVLPIDARSIIQELKDVCRNPTVHKTNGLPWDTLANSERKCSLALDKAQFERLCVYDRSPEGSNNRIAEEQSIYSWEMFLQDIEDKLFFTEQGRSPNVSTCSLELWIPRGIEDPEKLREIMIRCLNESCGFLKRFLCMSDLYS
ncbi:hypothetical protein MAR_014374 [Mya arenaria]|uniref:Uncharacterized protein n=1 Tax=Mya arenaria TaxID=6604 RepID=A0ABY7G2M0_MYAAR|nr:hypothetical protein MAR_014374 [Mya arenaria]